MRHIPLCLLFVLIMGCEKQSIRLSNDADSISTNDEFTSNQIISATQVALTSVEQSLILDQQHGDRNVVQATSFTTIKSTLRQSFDVTPGITADEFFRSINKFRGSSASLESELGIAVEELMIYDNLNDLNRYGSYDEIINYLQSETLSNPNLSLAARERFNALSYVIEGIRNHYTSGGHRMPSGLPVMKGNCGTTIGRAAISGAIWGSLTGLVRGCTAGWIAGPGGVAAGCIVGYVSGAVGGAAGGAVAGAIDCYIFD